MMTVTTKIQDSENVQTNCHQTEQTGLAQVKADEDSLLHTLIDTVLQGQRAKGSSGQTETETSQRNAKEQEKRDRPD